MSRPTNRAIILIIVILLIAAASVFAGPRMFGRCASETEIASLFDRWNRSLQTGEPSFVAELYAARSVLLPTLSDKARLTAAEKEDYFRHFLKNKPSARIDFRQIETGRDMAVDTGLYTFTFAKTGKKVSARYSFTYKWDGRKWLIVSHHSSLMPVSE
jgi:uncharacterized protein (TIGR02246 family)